MDLIYSQNNKWLNIKNVFLINKIEEKLKEYSHRNESINMNALKKLIYEELSKTNQIAFDIVPNHVIELSERFNFKPNYIDSEFICKTFKLNPPLMSNEQREELLNFLIPSENWFSNLPNYSYEDKILAARGKYKCSLILKIHKKI